MGLKDARAAGLGTQYKMIDSSVYPYDIKYGIDKSAIVLFYGDQQKYLPKCCIDRFAYKLWKSREPQSRALADEILEIKEVWL